MKSIMKPKYQYFLLPISFVFIGVIAAVNYILWKDIKKSFIAFLETFIYSIFLGVTPNILLYITGLNISDSIIFAIYFYTLSTVIGIYLIKKQEKYIEEKS